MRRDGFSAERPRIGRANVLCCRRVWSNTADALNGTEVKLKSEGVRRWLIMTVLSLSGGIIFLLPFLQEVYYKPLAEALALDNTEVGSLLSVFGVTAMLSYAPGGWLADRVSPRKLLTLSLLLTGGLGLYFASFPSYSISLAIHAIWGGHHHLALLGCHDTSHPKLGTAK